tara:strand:- start:982 stop:4509 length:3528 start_codon:yes stop_codon:yes gene_type:complete
MKKLYLACITFFLWNNICAQNTGDTIIIQTFIHDAWTDGNGNSTGSGVRDTIAHFPTDTSLTFEKIIMSYNMRCKDNVSSNPGGNSRIGCGAWDYSCHTYIHDSTRTDSILSFTSDYIITDFSGSIYNYSINPVFNYRKFLQYNVSVDSIINEDTTFIGSGTYPLDFVIEADKISGKSQFIYKSDELLEVDSLGAYITGLINDTINSISINVISNPQDIDFLKIKMKLTPDSILNPSDPHLDGFTQVYYSNTVLNQGLNRLQFYNPFIWDSSSNIIIEFSFTDSSNSSIPQILSGSIIDSIGMYTTDADYIQLSGHESIEVNPSALAIINDVITISFWANGDVNALPSNTTLFEGLDSIGNRTVNLHFPWSNGRIYWDCGNNGTSTYDRIDKAANINEYTGTWSHWAFTKNSNTGSMKIYRNGQLWHSGTGKTKTIDIDSFKIGSNALSSSNFWHGKIKEFRVFNQEIDANIIQDWMNRRLDSSHINYSDLVAYYPFNEGIGNIANDNSQFNQQAILNGNCEWKTTVGENINTFFKTTDFRPNISLYQGEYLFVSTQDTIIDSLQSKPNIVTQRAVFPNYGTMQNDSIGVVLIDTLWQSISYTYIYDTSGVISILDTVHINGIINIDELNYYNRYPMSLQIMSFVTPYGMGVDFGEFGESWHFDVTDYAPILKGKKRMTVGGGGQWQEDLDIRFLFIVGTPPRDVLDMQQIWRPQSKNHSTILSDRAFEPRSNIMLPNASSYKIRSLITGHGQDGEFIPRNHYLNIDGSNPPTSSWQVWTECADNPVYPQGGTWIYDRAGWCPGQPTDLKELDITTLVNPGQTHTFDYGVTSAGSSNYWVNNQLVSYSNPNFSLDATISEVLSPNDNIEFSRKNPICSNPKVLIQNTGSTTLISLDIEYWINNSLIPQSYSWSGNLDFLEEAEVELPVSPSFWQSLDSTQNVFYVKVMNPNGGVDEYSYNDLRESNFTPTPIYPSFFGLCIQTNSGTSLPFISETSWDIYDASGNTIYTSGSLSWGTQYRDSILLSPGCYRFEVKDTDDDGLDFWANNDGSGVIRFLTTPISCNAPPVNYFEADFGKYIFHEFRVVSTTALENLEDYPWKIYPNPTNGILSIQGLSNYNNSLRIYNKLGELILYEKLNFEGVIAKQIDISQLPAGIYFVHIEGSKEKVIKKLVKL